MLLFGSVFAVLQMGDFTPIPVMLTTGLTTDFSIWACWSIKHYIELRRGHVVGGVGYLLKAFIAWISTWRAFPDRIARRCSTL